jgi:hypothetical protein
MEGYGDRSDLTEEEAIITAISKDKAEDLLEVIRNGMDKDREVYRHPQTEQPLQPQQQSSLSIECSRRMNIVRTKKLFSVYIP